MTSFCKNIPPGKCDPYALQICMTLKGQHARSGYYVSENSREGVKNGNVDKIKWH